MGDRETFNRRGGKRLNGNVCRRGGGAATKKKGMWKRQRLRIKVEAKRKIAAGSLGASKGEGEVKRGLTDTGVQRSG